MPSRTHQITDRGPLRRLPVRRPAPGRSGRRPGDAFSQLRGRPGRVDPYAVYERIREQGGWVTTRLGNLATVDHAACSTVLRSRRFGVRPEGHVPGPDDEVDLSFLDRNPPDHTRLRRLASRAFSPRRVADYRRRDREGGRQPARRPGVRRRGRPRAVVRRAAADRGDHRAARHPRRRHRRVHPLRLRARERARRAPLARPRERAGRGPTPSWTRSSPRSSSDAG